jgi:recombination protein RecA
MSTGDRFDKELGLGSEFTDWGFLPTGLLALDQATGGGVPKGKVTEIYGPEGSAKTTLCMSIVAATQAAGGRCVYLDAEHAIDPSWAAKQGVAWDDLLIRQPDNAEDTLRAVEIAAEEADDLVILDSVAAMATKRQLAGDLSDSNVGDKARLMSQFFRELPAVANRTGTTVVFINQIREKIGVMFGSPETTPGGRALKYAAAMRLDTRRKERIPESGEPVVGQVFKVKCVKNKVAPPFRVAEYNLMFDTGIDYAADVLDVAVGLGLVNKSGSWYSDTISGEKMAQGKVKTAQWLRDNPEEYNAIRKAIAGG